MHFFYNAEVLDVFNACSDISIFLTQCICMYFAQGLVNLKRQIRVVLIALNTSFNCTTDAEYFP